jgi:hypothetical protein
VIDQSRLTGLTAARGPERVIAWVASVSSRARLPGRGAASTFQADGSGACNLQLAELRLQHVDIQLSGGSHANIQAGQTIAAQLSGASRLTYQGTPRFSKHDTSGGSTIQPR